jgi:gliding motility-associated-like protein
MHTGTVSTCGGEYLNLFTDSGWGVNYNNNENYTLTICPDSPGQVVELNFTSFNTEPNIDLLTIYDGADVLAPVFGTFSGSTGPGVIRATIDNPGGCITIVFTSDASINLEGWEAELTCFKVCQTIISQLDSASPLPNGDGYIRVCPDEEITLTGSATFSVDGTGATYEWNLGDGNTIAGQVATFSYPNPGVYLVNLNVHDTNTDMDPDGCSNSNLINQVIQVGNAPDFSATAAADSTVCLGESTTITGVVNAVEFNSDCTPPVSGITFLPDGTGVTYETSITVNCYNSSQTLTDISQLLSICLNMEHSFLGDLNIEIVSPIGQVVKLHDNVFADSQNLGIPWATDIIDNESNNTTPGIGYDYCFVPGNSFPTLVGGTQTGGIFPSGDGPGTYTDSYIPAGNYSSLQSLDGLLGSPLNGDWTIRITDNFPLDNGYIFEWGIEFDPATLPPNLSFTPVVVSENWDADPSIINVAGNVITVQALTAGTYCYTYRVVDDFGCEYTEEICIEFNPNPSANPVANQIICDDDNDGFWEFDFSLLDATVLGAQSGSDFEITYHFSLTEAIDDINAIPSPYINAVAYQEEEIFIRIESIINSNCFDTTSFLIDVLDIPVANPATDIELCDNADDGNDANGLVTFDLSSKFNEVLGGQSITDFEVKFYLSQAEADAGLAGTEIASPFQNTSNPEVIFARIENRLNPVCFDTTSYSLIVHPLPVVTSLVELKQCDDDTDGYSSFNLTESYALISANYLNETITFHTSLLDAENGLANITNETIYINTDPSAAPDILFVRTENDEGCYRTSQLNLIVSTTQISADFQLNYEVCDDDLIDGDNFNGIANFDFSDATSQVINLFPLGQSLTISYYQNIDDALSEINPIPDISNYRNESSPNSQIIYVRVDGDADNGCLGLGGHITLQVNPLPVFDLEDDYLLCLDTNGTETIDIPVLDTQLSESEYSFEWSLNNTIIDGFTGSSYTPEQGGNYSVLVTNISTGCQIADATIVNEGGPPIVSARLTSPLFADVHVIETTVTGNGIYEYSLDDGPWQDSGIFENVSAGEHIVTVRDLVGCGSSSVIVIVIGYPLYFTPNEDGFHDTWNIIGIADQLNAKIFIYDRYGKLLKQMSPSSTGWDGTFNGHPLPTSDYWFTVEFIEPKDGTSSLFRAHFTLKR